MNWVWIALMSAVFYAAETILRKKILKKEHALRFSAVIAISIFFLSLVFLPYLNFDKLSITILLLIYFNSWLTSIAFLLTSKAIRHMEVSIVSPLSSLAPLFILIFSLLFLKERITDLQIYGISLFVIGTYILQSNKNDYLAPIKAIIKSRYIHFIFISLILTGLSSTLDRYVLKDNLIDPISYLFLISTFLAINYSILITILYKGFKDINKGFKVNGLMILIMAVLLIAARLALYTSFSLESAFLVDPIKGINILLVVLFGGTLFHEKDIFKKIIASLFMLGGAYLIVI